MKKIVSIFLALVMILAITIPAFATTITFDDPISDVERDYLGYQLLTLKINLKLGAHGEGCDGTNHKDTCYTYVYEVNGQYLDVLKAETGAGTAEEVVAFFASKTDADMRAIADGIYKAIKEDDGITAEYDSTEDTNEIAQGYWLFADVTGLNGENEANSFVMVDTKGVKDLTVTVKTGLPTVEKKVKDINDSTDADITDNIWQDNADHDTKGAIPFKLTATMPSNLMDYEAYKIIFHDTLAAGFTLDETSFKVYKYDSKTDADADVALENGTDVTASFEKGVTADGCSFEFTCEDVLLLDGVDTNTVFVVYYEATLNNNANIGKAGNENSVYLEFTNNPYTDGTGKTETDTVVVYTYKLTVNKTDGNGNALAGAGFTLSKKNPAGGYDVVSVIGASEATSFTWTYLDDGEYLLEETTVPTGYNGMDPIYFTVSADHDPELEDLTAGGFDATITVADGLIEGSIANRTGTELPETGAMGTMWLIGGGTMLVIIATVFMVTRKKMSVFED